MKGMLYTADHHVYELPPLLEWNVRHTGTVPCDSWSVTAVYRPEMAPVLKMAAGFAAVEDGQTQLRGIVDEYSVELDQNGLTVTLAGRQLVLDESSPIRSCRLREDHYGVITEALVIDKRQNISYSVRNPEMIRKGGQCRRVVYTPGKSTWAAMRYTGEYQIQQSRQDEKTVTVSLPGSFGAFPGDRAELRLSKLGLEGFFRVAEAENRFSAREGAVMTWTLKECE